MANESRDPSRSSSQQPTEDWSNIEDQQERRRVQNRIAQRTYRARKKNEAEENARIAENQQAAGAAYTAPKDEDLSRNNNPSGLPWGSYAMKPVDAGQSSKASQAGSSTGSSRR